MIEFKKNINLIINIKELRIRLFYFILSFFLIFFVSFIYRVELFFFISQFLLKYEEGFIYTSLLEPFLIYLKLSILFTFVFSTPFFIYIFGFFFFKGTYTFYTFYYFYFFIFFYLIVICFFIIISFSVLPFILEFLLSFQRIKNFEILQIILQATMNQYFNFFINYFLIYLFIVFAPNLILFLILTGILKKSFFLSFKFRKYLYLIVLISFLIFAPPDFLVQLLLLPIVILILEVFIYLTTI